MSDLNLSEDFIQQNGFTPEQVAAVSEAAKTHISTLQEQWSADLVEKGNPHAQAILDGAIAPVEEATGIKRNQGEKQGEYFKRVGLSTAEIARLKKDFEDKITNFKGDESLKTQLEEFKQKAAELEPFKEYKDKYEKLESEHLTLKETTAFTLVKPVFPTSVNQYEANAKYKAFIDGVKEKHTIEMIQGEPYAVDKVNNHIKTKLSDLVAADKSISELMTEQTSENFGGSARKEKTIDGVPFKVPENADVAEKTKLIKEQLTKEGLNSLSDAYSKKFKEYMDKIG